jgi:predicted dehydrogenase
MAKRMNVAIVGCGWVSDWHVADGLALLPDLFTVAACCDTDAERLKQFAARYGVERQVRNYADVLSMPDIDAVVVCTPPALHHDMVIAALRAGKHVVCEKPFSDSLASVDEIRRIEASASVRVMPVFQYRFGDGLSRVRHIIRSGIAGRHFVSSVETAKQRGPDYYAVAWRGKFSTELGGVLLTQAIHMHDLLLCLLGPVAQVSCFKTTRVNPIEVEDCAVASLRMADGSLASLCATLGSARQVSRMRLCFENVTFERTGYDDESSRPADEPWVVIPKNAEVEAKIAEAERSLAPERRWFARQYELFHGALASGVPFPVTLDDARASIELITAMFHSDETGGAVSLPIGPQHPKYRGWTPA